MKLNGAVRLKSVPFNLFQCNMQKIRNFKHFSWCCIRFRIRCRHQCVPFHVYRFTNTIWQCPIYFKREWFNQLEKTTTFSVTLYQVYLMLDFSNFEITLLKLRFLRKCWKLLLRFCIDFFNFSKVLKWILIAKMITAFKFEKGKSQRFTVCKSCDSKKKIHKVFSDVNFAFIGCLRQNWRIVQRSALDWYYSRSHSRIYTYGLRDDAHSLNCVLNFGSFYLLREISMECEFDCYYIYVLYTQPFCRHHPTLTPSDSYFCVHVGIYTII